MLDNQRRWAVALAAVFWSAAAFAQLAGTVGAQPVPPATPQQPGKIVGSLTFGGEVQNGRTETRGYMGSGSFAYMNKRLQVFRLDLSSMHSDLRDRNTGTRYTLQETGLASLTFTQPVKPRISSVTVAMVQHDSTQLLDSRELLTSGVAFQLVRTPRALFTITPGVGIGHQESRVPNAPSTIRAVGIYQNSWVQLTHNLSLVESVITFRDVKVTQNKSLMLSSMLIAQVAKKVGISIYYNYWREGLLPPNTPPSQSQFGVGLTLTL